MKGSFSDFPDAVEVISGNPLKLDSMDQVETRYFNFAEPSENLDLESGEKLGPVTLAYETYGCLNAQKSNAVLICHALSGDAHAAGYHAGEQKPGWWDNMIGAGRAFDTDRYFVLCSNVIGGCKGSTGPASLNPATGKPYGLSFPVITIRDMVEAQRRLIDFFGIERLLCVAGGSMGGMQALQWAASYPQRVRSVIAIATTARHSPLQIAFNEVIRQSIMADRTWRSGDYYDYGPPDRGLAIARMIGHITFMSEASMEQKFSRNRTQVLKGIPFDPEFEVGGYLKYRGNQFVKRFDANAYLYITRALDYFDLSGDRLISPDGVRDARFLIISFSSDWLYPPSQSQDIVRQLKKGQVDVTSCELNSSYGHDAFLVETEGQTTLIRNFLSSSHER
ncbi:homoserine O-acetyltransferase MetX [Syntrophus aciditrophicus]|uniref:Homoserine O-acetyltransferase n=1 Tax=Syntrophus aciditrophicus (strain SB) TaxID=56780 RepID=Q2LWA7_SYNAS|nr:homoserine O-acetyltransferase [Syntrophus aciditrophicus]ABC78370.1 homoserine o-acetyltransferase [Syntrophus aciditrophicus SB]